MSESLDITPTTEARSDQQNFDDYVGGSKVVTVSEVKRGSAEQPVEVHLVEYPGKPYKPSKSMRRVLVAAWGGDAANYPGRQLELYGDPTVKFGKDAVGGIKIARMSHLHGPVTIKMTVSRGRREDFTVQPLEVADPVELLRAAPTLAKLQHAWAGVQKAGLASNPEIVALKDARKKELADE